jgi:hypothetical protein
MPYNFWFVAKSTYYSLVNMQLMFVELDPRNQVCINGVLVDDNFTCICSPGYTGSICDVPIIAECEVNPCQNGGNCSMVATTPVCDCPEGFNGSTCSTSSKHQLQVGVYNNN